MDVNTSSDIQSKNFLLYEGFDKLLSLTKGKESVTLQFIPFMGASRVLRKLIAELGVENKYVSISLDSYYQSKQSLQDTIRGLEEDLRSFGVETGFIAVTNIDLDHDFTPAILEKVSLFSKAIPNYPSVVYFLTGNILEYREKLRKTQSLFNNILYFSPSQDGFVEFLIKQNEERYACSTSEDEKEEISRLTGGISILVRNCVAQLSREGKFNLGDLRFLAESMLSELPEKELDMYRRALKGKLSDFEHKHLLDLGLIDVDSTIKSSLLTEALKTYHRDYLFEYRDGKVFIAGNDRTGKFSDKELIFLSNLYSKGTVLRDDASRIFAGAGEYLEYSEEALDKAVSRLRSKMKRLGLSPKRLITRKGVGYEYSKIDQF